MKKNLLISCCIIIILSFIMISNFNMLIGVYNDPVQDTSYHMLRIFGIIDSTNNHYINFLYLNNFGYAQPLFYTDVIIYPIIKILSALTDNIVVIYNLNIIFYMSITFLISSFIYYKMRNKILESQIFAVLYTFNIYRLNDIYVRGAISEFVALTFIPLFIYSIYLIYNNLKEENYTFNKSYFLFIITLVLVIYSHAISSIMFFTMYLFTFIILLILFRKKWFLIIKNLMFSSFIILLLSSFYLLPLLEQLLDNTFYFQLTDKTSCYVGYDINDVFNVNFIHNMRYNIITFIPIIVGIVVFTKSFIKKKNDSFYNTILAAYILCLAMIFIIPVCSIPLIKNIQFPWRFLGFINGLGVFLLVYSIKYLNNSYLKKAYYIILIVMALLIIPLEFNKYNNGLNKENFDDKFTIESVEESIGNGEYLPASFDIDYATNFVENGTQTTYKDNMYIIEILDTEKEKYELPIIYYKGYEANNEKVEIKQSPNGLIEININGNIDRFEITYKRTFIQYLSILFTIIGIVLLGYLIFKSGKRK